MSVEDRLHSVTVLLAIPLLVNLYGRWFIAQHLVAVWFLDAAFAAAAFQCVLAVVVHKSSTSAIGVVARLQDFPAPALLWRRYRQHTQDLWFIHFNTLDYLPDVIVQVQFAITAPLPLPRISVDLCAGEAPPATADADHSV
ncbi:MAG: hypothetical protein WB762_28680 [Candidatus Sulfotelmatobacter sp.]